MTALRLCAALLLAGTALVGCGDSDPDPEPTTPTTPTAQPDPLPDLSEVPLTQGWVAEHGEIVDFDSIVEVARCGTQTFPAPEPAEWRGVQFQAPENFRSRQLFAYHTEGEAAAALEVVADHSCAEADAGGSPPVLAHQLVQVTGESPEMEATVAGWYSVEGEVIVGATTTVAVQRGRFLLISHWSTEGLGRRGANQMIRDDQKPVGKIADFLAGLE